MTGIRDRTTPKRLKLKRAIEALLRDEDAMAELAWWRSGEGNSDPDEALDEIREHLDAIVRTIGYVPAKTTKRPTPYQLELLGYARDLAIKRRRAPTMAETTRHAAEQLNRKESGVRSELKRIKEQHPDAWEHFHRPPSKDTWAHIAAALQTDNA